MLARVLVLVLVALVLAAGPVQAQAITWRSLAFAGAKITALATGSYEGAPGRILYVGTDLGLQVSEDGGDTWLYAGQDLDAKNAGAVVALAIDPRNARRVFAGTEPGPNGGIYLTEDLGRHWERILAGQHGEGFPYIVINQEEPERIAAVSYLFSGGDDALVLSKDGGHTWSTYLSPGSGRGQKLLALSFQPGRPETLYVATTMGVLVTRDSGQTWQDTSDPQSYAYGLAVLTGRGESVYAAGLNVLYFSRNGAAGWQVVQGPPLSTCEVVSHDGLASGPGQGTLVLTTRGLCPDTKAKVYATLFGGGRLNRWTDITAGLPQVTELGVRFGGPDDGRLYALTPDGLWVTDLPTPVRQGPRPTATATATATPQPTALPAPAPTPLPQSTPPASSGPSLPGGAGPVALVSVTTLAAVAALAFTRRHRGTGA